MHGACLLLQLLNRLPNTADIPVGVLDFLRYLIPTLVHQLFQFANSGDHAAQTALLLPVELFLKELDTPPQQVKLMLLRRRLSRLDVEAGEMATVAGGAGHGIIVREVDAGTAVSFDLG